MVFPASRAGSEQDARTQRPRVIVVDDHTFYRDGLVGLLVECGVDVVADVANGEAALTAVPVHRPDIVIMDLSMPGLGGVESTRRLLQAHPGVRVIMLTVSQEEEDILHAILAGARGFVLKDGPIDDVVTAIDRVSEGLPFFSPKVAPRLLRHVAGTGRRTSGPNRLSPRETEVLSRIADGQSPGDIAKDLGLADADVQDLVAGILVKVQAESRGEIAVRAIRDRIV